MSPLTARLADVLPSELQHEVDLVLPTLVMPDLSAEQQQDLKLLLAVSPFLSRVMQQQPELIVVLMGSELLAKALTHQNPLSDLAEQSEATVFKVLRRCRNAQLAQILAADILAVKSTDQCLLDISAMADNLINSAYQWAYQDVATQWGQPLDQQGNPMPLLILGMGKLGGGELNFSSDIDLIFTYPHNGETSGGRRSVENQQFFTKLGQKLISALHQVTADGFVFRVDMRLRPFGDSGPLVLSFAAMEDYYQAQGREWERYR